MPYYQGDFYAGDFYPQGDPGLFSFLGRIGKAALGFIPGVGPVAQKAVTAIQKVGARPIVQRTGQIVAGAVAKHPVLTAAAAVGAVGTMGAGLGRMTMGGRRAVHGQPGQRGYHESKKHPGLWVRNRRMNVCNPRALRRSLRRAHGFAKLAIRTIHLVHPKKKGRFGGFKKRRAARV